MVFAAQHSAIIGGGTDLEAYCLDLIHQVERECTCTGHKHNVVFLREKAIHSPDTALQTAASFAVRTFSDKGRVYVAVIAPSARGKRKAGCDGPPLVIGAVGYDS